MIIHNPIISGSIQFPADADGNKVTLQVNSGVLETIQIDSSNNATSVKPESNLSGSFTGSFQGDGSALTGVSSINIDALNSLGGATVAQGDNLVISDAGTEKKVTFSNLEDSIFGNISGNATIAAGGVLTIASSFLNTSLNAATGSYLTTVDISDDTNLAVSDTSEVNMILNGDTLSAELIGGVVSGSDQIASTFAQTILDDTSAGAVRTTIGVDAAGTDNSTDVTLAGNDYLTISGQAITAGAINNDDLTNSSITIDGSAISLGGSVTTTNTQLSTEAVQDIVGAMFSGNTETRISVTYQDGDGTIDLVADDMTANDNTQNTTTLSFVDSTDDIILRNTTSGASSGTDDIKFVAGSNITLTHTDADNITISSTDTNTVYSHPTFDGDDISIDTTALTGATVISDLDFNITTDTNGHVTDANGSVATRTLTATDLSLGNVTNESKATMFSSPALTGNPTAPTQADNDDSTKIATTAYVQREVSDLLGGAPAAFDTLLEISASIANGDSDVVALTTTVGTKLAKSSNLSDLANAGTARTNLGVDAAGTDNSTDVTLVGSLDYLTISGQAITLGAITNDDLAGSITNAKLSNSAITVDGNSISLGGSVTTLQLGTSGTTALAGDTTTITDGQASAITANTAKISYNSSASTKLGTIEENADVTDAANVTTAGALMDSEVTNLAQVKSFDSSDYLASSTTTISDGQASAITANTAKTGITPTQAGHITANNAKVSATSANVVSALVDEATDFGSGRVSGDLFGDVAGSSTMTGSFVGDGSGLTGVASTLTFGNNDVSSNSTVDLKTQHIDFVGTSNEIETSISGQTVTIGIPTNPTLSGNVTVTGNLNVEGTTTTIDSTTVNIGDRILELNYAGGAGDAGLLVSDVDGSSTVSGSLLWDASSDYWMAGKLGSEKEIALLNAAPTSNRVLKANASGLLVDSTITDDGTDVSITGDLTVTGLAAGANGAFLYADANEKLQAVNAASAGDVIQWNGSSFVASNAIDGGTF